MICVQIDATKAFCTALGSDEIRGTSSYDNYRRNVSVAAGYSHEVRAD